MFDPMIYEANGSSSACRRKRARQVETSTPPPQTSTGKLRAQVNGVKEGVGIVSGLQVIVSGQWSVVSGQWSVGRRPVCGSPRRPLVTNDQ